MKIVLVRREFLFEKGRIYPSERNDRHLGGGVQRVDRLVRGVYEVNDGLSTHAAGRVKDEHVVRERHRRLGRHHLSGKVLGDQDLIDVAGDAAANRGAAQANGARGRHGARRHHSAIHVK